MVVDTDVTAVTARVLLLSLAVSAAASASACTAMGEAEEKNASRATDVRSPLPALVSPLSASDRARFAELPARQAAVPVLLFHQICAEECRPEVTYGMSRAELARTLAMLAGAGFETISVADYVRFLHGVTEGLPRRPILLTFDDGWADAWVGAHALLAQANARATMFVITANAEARKPDYMTWSEIAAAAASGHWDIQLHAHAGHSLLEVGFAPDGSPSMRHAYAWRRHAPELASGGLESFAAWRRRVVDDLDRGDALLAAHVPGYVSSTFAVPYSDYGQVSSNDQHIAPTLRGIFDDRFDAWFTQRGPDPELTLPGPHQEKSRYVVFRTTTAEEIYLWLAEHAAR